MNMDIYETEHTIYCDNYNEVDANSIHSVCQSVSW